MNIVKIAMLSFLAVMLSCNAYAANVTLKSVIEAVESPLKSDYTTGRQQLETVTADFFQKTVLAKEKREMRADGEMSVKFATENEPLKFRFEYFRPTKQEIISDGRLLWMYMPESRRVIRSELEGVMPDPRLQMDKGRGVNFLQGLSTISKDFNIVYAYPMNDMNGNFVLELDPKRSMASIRKIFMVVRKEAVLARVNGAKYPFKTEYAFPILSTTVYDHDDNLTTIEFSNIRVNQFIPDILFSFIPPATAEVVRPPQ